MEVTVRELKAHLSAFVRRVQAGETALIMSHRKPGTRFAPLPSGDSVTDRLLAAGVVSARPTGDVLHRRGSNPLPPGVGSVADAAIEDRG